MYNPSEYISNIIIVSKSIEMGSALSMLRDGKMIKSIHREQVFGFSAIDCVVCFKKVGLLVENGQEPEVCIK